MNFISDYFHKAKKKTAKKTNDSKADNTWSGAIKKSTPIRECPFVVFDTELSGLDPRKDFIVSVGAIKMTGETIHISKEFYRLVKPAGMMTNKNIEIHGITPGELEKQESMDTVLPDFLDFIRDSVMVGHFVNIDIDFMNAAIEQAYNTKLANPAVDTHDVHEWLYKNGAEFKRHYQGGSTSTDLFSIANKYGITIDTAHNSLKDAFITAQLFQKFLYFVQAEGVRTLNDLFDIGRA